MSKADGKKNKKHADAVARKSAMKALRNAPVIRDALIAAIEAGAAAAIAVIRKASDAELVKPAEKVEAKPEKKSKKKTVESNLAEMKPAKPAA